MTYHAQYNWTNIAGSLDGSVEAVTQDQAVSAIIVTLLILLAAVVIVKRVVHG